MSGALRLAALSCALAALPCAALAQAKPDLSGRWQLDVAASDYGQNPGPRQETDTIDLTETQLRLHVASTTRDITETYDLSLPLDGRMVTVDGGVHVDPARILTAASARWDGPVLVLHQRLATDSGPFEAVSRYALSSDGTTLSVQLATADGRPIRVLVYDRCAAPSGPCR